tara:strand:+ start:88 stop:450 length:363 start_codon:yes stop_codon:yes gene_type:complete
MFFWMYYERIIFAEERFLRQRFGEPYLKWAMKTPIFIPKLRGWQVPNLNFSLKNVLQREYSGFFALFFSFTLYDLIENYIRYDIFFLNDFWAYSLLISALISVTLRTLKKKTNILHVKGR